VAAESLATDAAADPAFREIHDSYFAWRDQSNDWLATAEHTYANFVFG